MNPLKLTRFEMQQKLQYWTNVAKMRQSFLAQMYIRGREQLDSGWDELTADTQAYAAKQRDSLQFAMDSIQHYETLLKAEDHV